MREDGKISIVAPVSMEAAISVLYIFNTFEDEAAGILKEDPAVVAGIFTFVHIHARAFPAIA